MKLLRLFQLRNKTFLSWLTSYAVILMLPIVIGSFVYYQSIIILKEETESIHSSNLNQLKLLMDGKLTELNRIGSEISLNSQIKAFINLHPPLSQSDEYTKKEIQDYITRYETTNSFINNIYIYFKEGNFFLSSSSLYREDTFRSLCSDNFGMSYDELSRFIRSTRYLNYKIVQTAAQENVSSGKIIIAHAIISGSIKNPSAMMLMVVDNDKVAQLMKNIVLASKETVIISDSRNNFLSSGKISNLPSFLSYKNLKESGRLFYTRYSGENCTVMHVPSSVNGWQYISVMPSRTYLQKVEYIKTIMFIYIGFCLVAGLIISYYITKKNYSPINKLTQLFMNDSGEKIRFGQNEFSFLEKGVKDLLNEKATISRRLDQQSQALRNLYIIRLLRGRNKTDAISRESLEQYKITFSGNDFLVLLFQIEDIDRKFMGSVTAEQEESVELAYFIIRNIIEELINEKYVGYSAEIDGMPVCLVNFDASCKEDVTEESIISDMEQIASRVKEFINANFGISMSIAISNIHSAAAGIAKAYLESVELIDYKTLTGESDAIIQYHSIALTEDHEYKCIHSLSRDRLLIRSIIDEDYKNAGRILDEIFTSEFHEKKHSLQMVKFRMFGIANSILAALGETKTTGEMDFMNELDPINRIINAKSVTELQKQANYIFQKISDYYSTANKECISGRVGEIEEYIRNHFHEHDISVMSICDRFQITPSYFSRIFKKHTDMNLPEYLHKLRIEKAKQLLRNTDLNMNDIAEKVGFYNSLTFGRVFKKYEGVTPGQFREKG